MLRCCGSWLLLHKIWGIYSVIPFDVVNFCFSRRRNIRVKVNISLYLYHSHMHNIMSGIRDNGHYKGERIRYILSRFRQHGAEGLDVIGMKSLLLYFQHICWASTVNRGRVREKNTRQIKARASVVYYILYSCSLKKKTIWLFLWCDRFYGLHHLIVITDLCAYILHRSPILFTTVFHSSKKHLECICAMHTGIVFGLDGTFFVFSI